MAWVSIPPGSTAVSACSASKNASANCGACSTIYSSPGEGTGLVMTPADAGAEGGGVAPRALLADDHGIVRRGMRGLLESRAR